MTNDKQKDRLVELLDEAEYKNLDYEMANKFFPFDNYKSRSEFVADYLLANGVIVPPCKVGQEVYIVYHKEVIQGNVNRIRPFVSKKETVFKGNVVCEVEDIFYNDGRKEEIELYVVFEKPYGTERVAYLTKEEAEAKLKEGVQG